MEYQQFISAVEKKVRQCVKENITVYTHVAVKNNGKERSGITFIEQGINVSPTIYLEEYYEQFRQGNTMECIVERIVELYREIRFQHSWEENCIKDYARIKEKIVYKLINREANEECLESIPHIVQLDLAIVFYVLLELNEYGTATMLIKDEYLSIWNVTKEELYEEAHRNTQSLLPAEFRAMTDVIETLMIGEGMEDIEYEAPDSMYVLTNQIRSFGAACLLYEGELERIGRMLGENFYVIPSSVHEVIIVPESESPDKRELEEIITEMNATQVEEEEVLSDRAYYYSCKGKRLIM